MIKYNIEVSKYFSSLFQDKYDAEMFKKLETKTSCRVLINYNRSRFIIIDENSTGCFRLDF